MAEFKQIKENLNALNLSEDSLIYDYARYHNLVDAARKVREISVFSSYETPLYCSLRPFHYQETAVQTMLIDFEGRGVFGDQVGLGKTIEALMTAHIMFRQKEIRNMLVVCPANLVDQWTGEIMTKFRDTDGDCVFDIKLDKDSSGNWSLKNSVQKLKDQIKEAGDAVTDKLPVFFLSTTSLTSPANIQKEEENAAELRRISDEIAKIQARIAELEAERQRACDVNRMNSPRERDEYDRAVRAAQLSGCPIEEKFAPLKKILSEMEVQKALLNQKRADYEAKKGKSLWEMPVDLLVVDEADTVVSDAMGKKKDKNDETSYAALIKSRKALMNFRKKYCILVSATPIRAQLEDIYYLVKIVDENRFVNEEAFYTYVGAHSLAELVKDDELIKRLIGLINTMFTRARMHDKHVTESYPPEEGHTLDRIIDALLGSKSAAKKIWTRERYPVLPKDEIADRLEKLRACVENSVRIFCDVQEIKFENGILETIYGRASQDKVYKKIVMRGMRDYYLETRDVFIHPYIDWSRQKKQGHCENIHGNDAMQNSLILQSLGSAFGDSSERGSEKVVIFEGKLNNRKLLYEQLRRRFPKRKIFADIKDPVFWKTVGADTKITDLDDDEDDSYEDDGPVFDKQHERDYKAFKRWNVHEFFRTEPEYADAIYLIDQTRKEGANLNCASRLIVCQITASANSGLMDPLRFEQIIGRLNRVGQMDNILIDVYVDNEREEALYYIYADPEGLDMVGYGKPEVSFIIPIVTEIFREKKKEHGSQYKDLKKDADFIDIFNYCYDNGLLEEFRSEIRRLCGILMVRNVQEER